jgi:hypothetical protein
MVSVLATAVIDRRFEPQSSQMKKYKISICSFSAKHATVRAKTGRLGLLVQLTILLKVVLISGKQKQTNMNELRLRQSTCQF